MFKLDPTDVFDLVMAIGIITAALWCASAFLDSFWHLSQIYGAR
ncbi:hypothetical protein [Anatilimnocola floriformis]|nr:hypothetical protein [Anatilimnocola floriformis]